MVFATFQGELVDIAPASLLGVPLIVMLLISLSCQFIIIALILRGNVALTSKVLPWVCAVLLMGLTGPTISLVICLTDHPSHAAAQWLAYLLYLNAATGASVCQLELFKFSLLLRRIRCQGRDSDSDHLFYHISTRIDWPLCNRIQ